MNWISVQDKMPDPVVAYAQEGMLKFQESPLENLYLVYSQENGIEIARCHWAIIRDKDVVYWTFHQEDSNWQDPKITHWMPLPPKPKE